MSRRRSSASSDGPAFEAERFLNRADSMCAWSGWRVRSPIQSIWAEVAYH